MAGRIKGITVEIGGDTTGLETALSDVNRQSKSLQNELKEVQRALKFDPGNTTLIAQQQEILSERIAATSQKLQQLKSVQSQVEQQFQSGQLGVEQYRAFQRELETTEGQLDGLRTQLQQSQQTMQDLARNTQDLETYFNATGTTVADFADVLGNKLTTAIQNGTASAAQIDQAITKIGQAAVGADVDVERFRTALQQVGEGGSIDQVADDIQQMRNELTPVPSVVDNVRASLQSVEAASGELTAELKQVQAALRLDPNNITLVRQQQDLLGQSIQQTEQKLDGLKQAQQQVEAAFASGDLGVAEYRAFQRELGQTEAQLSNLNSALQRSQSEQQAVVSSMQQLNRFFEATGTSVQDFANVIGPELAASISQGRASSQQLERALTQIGQEALGASADLDRLRSALQQVGNGGDLSRLQQELQEIERQAGQTEEAVSGIGDGIKEGIAALAGAGGLAATVQQALDVSSLDTKIEIMFDVPEESKASVRDAVNGVTAYGVDAEAALQGVQRQWALNADASDASNAAIVQGAGMIASAYSEIDFNELIQESYEMGKSMGISQEEALGLTNALLKAGFPAGELDIISEYGTQLHDAGYNAKEIQAIMAAGVDTGTWNIDNLLDGVKEGRIRMAEFGQEIPKSLDELLQKTDLSSAQMQKWGNDVAAGGKKGSKAMNEVSEWLSTVEDDTLRNALGTEIFGTKWEDQGSKITDTLMNASKSTNELSDNQKKLKADIDTINADPMTRIREALTDIQTALAPVLASVAEFIAKIADWVSNNAELVGAITAVVAVIGMISAAIMVLTPIFTVVSSVISGFGVVLGILAGPIGIAIAAIALLVGAVVLIYQNWGPISEFFSSLWEGIKSVFTTVVTAIGEFLSTAWTSIVAALTAVWSSIIGIAQITWGLLTAFFAGLWNGITAAFTAVWTTITTVLTSLWTGIVTAATTIWTTLVTFFSTIWSTVSAVFSAAWAGIQAVLTTVWSAIVASASGIWSGLTAFFSTLWNGVKTIFTTIWNGIKSTLATIWNSLKSVATTAFNGVKSTITTIFNAVKSTITSIWNGIKSALTSVWNSLKSVATSAFNAVKTTITTIFNSIKSTASSVWNGIKSTLTSIWNSLKSVASSTFNAMKSTITSIFNAIKSVATSVWNGIKSVVTSAVNGIKSVVTSVFNAIKSVVTSVMNGVKSVITSAWNGAKSVVTSAVNGIKSIVTSVFNSLKSVVSSAMNGVTSAIKNGWNAAKSFLSSINLVSIGKNIIQGLVNGIKSGAGAVSAAIQEVAGNIKKKIKGALGIHSPSRWMRDEIGKNIDAGLAKGITADKKSEQAAAKKAKAIKNQFTNDLKNVQMKYNADKIDTKEYIGQLNKLKIEYKNYADGVKKIDVEINKANKKQTSNIKSEYSTRLKELKNNYNADLISNKQYINALQKMKKDYGSKVKGSESELNAKIKELKDSAATDNLKRYEKQISNEEKYNNASLNKQIKFWEKRLNKFKKNSEEYLAVQDKITDLTFRKEAERLKKYEATYNDKVKYDGKTLEWELRYWENRLDNFRKGSDEYLSIQDKLKELRYKSEQETLAATETYLDNIKKAEEDYVTNSTKLWDDYNKTLDDRTKSLVSFAGLFDEITASDDTVTGEQLMGNLQSQTNALEDWMNDIASLAERGLDSGLLKELEEMGPKSAQQIKALTTLSNEQLTEYTELWKTKSQLARQQATKELGGLRLDTEKQVSQMRDDTKTKLAQYQMDWQKSMKAVRKVSESELSAMPSIGANAVQGLIDGMQSKKEELKSVVEEIASIITDTTQSELDIHSPSRVMRRLGEYTNEGFIVGLQRTAAKVQSVMQGVYGSVANSVSTMQGSSTVNNSSSSISNDYSKTFQPSVVIQTSESPERAVKRELSRMAFKF